MRRPAASDRNLAPAPSALRGMESGLRPSDRSIGRALRAGRAVVLDRQVQALSQGAQRVG